MNWHNTSPVLIIIAQNSRDVLEIIFLDCQRLWKYISLKTSSQLFHSNISTLVQTSCTLQQIQKVTLSKVFACRFPSHAFQPKLELLLHCLQFLG